MNRWTELEQGKALINLFGKEHQATIKIMFQADYEPVNGSFDFGDEQENAAYLARFESGEIVNVLIKVVASLGQFHGDDFLGGCHLVCKEMHA